MKEKLLRKQFLHTSTFIFQSEMSPQFSCHLGAASATISKKKKQNDGNKHFLEFVPIIQDTYYHFVLLYSYTVP